MIKLNSKIEELRQRIIEQDALGIICNLLAEEAKGPQRRTSMQILLELSSEGNAIIFFVYQIIN